MLGRTVSDHRESQCIRFVVKDEDEIYTTFNEEDEFSDSVKSYIRAKITSGGYKYYTGLTVISRKPIDEHRFRRAVKNWITEEQKVLQRDKSDTIRMLIGLLLFGSVLIVFSIKLQQKYELAKYSLVPIMASLGLSRATGILVIDLPILSAKLKLLKKVESESVITFEYHPDAKGAT